MSTLPGLIFDSGFGGVRAGGAYFVGRTDLLFARQRVGRDGHKRSVMHVIGKYFELRSARSGSRLISGVWRGHRGAVRYIAVAPPCSFATTFVANGNYDAA